MTESKIKPQAKPVIPEKNVNRYANADQQGQSGNTKQNTTHQGLQQNR